MLNLDFGKELQVGGQSIDRRDALRYIGIASVAATFPGFTRWTFACSPDDHLQSIASAPASATPHQPLFLSSEHFRLVEHLSEMIIPADDTPGAKDAGVAEFIDFMLANRVPVNARGDLRSTPDAIRAGEDAQIRFLAGLNWLNAHCKSEFGGEFLNITSEQQKSLLESLAYKSKFKPTTESGRDFFQMLRDYTAVGFYTTKIGLESLGYPGLRTAWPKMPGCTHPDDPEHVHLPESGQHTSASLRIVK